MKRKFILYGLVFEVGLLGVIFFFPASIDEAFMCFGGHIVSMFSGGEGNAATWHRVLRQPGSVLCLWVISVAVTGFALIGILRVFDRAMMGSSGVSHRIRRAK